VLRPVGGSPLLGSPERRRSSGVEQLSCKQQVVGSNPTAGSSLPNRIHQGRTAEMPMP
jgi:hypothetical protein